MTSYATIEEQLTCIYQNTRFLDAMRVMQRIIANNVFITAQKRFTGLSKRDLYALDLEFNYRLDLLWIHVCDLVRGRPVSSLRWSPANTSILAVGYATKTGSDTENGVLLIWCAKNPSEPARCYTFRSSISDINWSKDRPNLLAVGFYDGSVKVIDISANDVNVIRKSRRETSQGCSPHWQVKILLII